LYDIDCMLSIDSAIAHLSLAMDIPTIVLLHPRFDWRWGKFENPKSYFWPKAKCFIIKEQEETKRNLQKLIKDILN
ncbi:glycosyltransferase family 9 protein, partial [Campylobacter jejuni]|nr:glycosyltransferase family 9 protein [Campylobacter jejuni]